MNLLSKKKPRNLDFEGEKRVTINDQQLCRCFCVSVRSATCTSLSVSVECVSISLYVAVCLCVSIFISIYPSLSVYLCLSQSIWCLSMSVYVCLYVSASLRTKDEYKASWRNEGARRGGRNRGRERAPKIIRYRLCFYSCPYGRLTHCSGSKQTCPYRQAPKFQIQLVCACHSI